MEPPVEPIADRCPRCGAPHEPYQEYCLECGARLPLAYPLRYEPWSRESPLWLWAALVALLLIALVAGAIVAVAATRDEEDEERIGAVAPETTEPVGVITGAETLTIPPATITVAPPTGTVATVPTVSAPPAGIDWPAGKDGFTVVLASVETSAGRAGTKATAERALSQGLPQVGILNSSNFSSLRPGFFVVFSGVYDTLGQAEDALGRARSSGFPLAYVREIRR